MSQLHPTWMRWWPRTNRCQPTSVRCNKMRRVTQCLTRPIHDDPQENVTRANFWVTQRLGSVIDPAIEGSGWQYCNRRQKVCRLFFESLSTGYNVTSCCPLRKRLHPSFLIPPPLESTTRHLNQPIQPSIVIKPEFNSNIAQTPTLVGRQVCCRHSDSHLVVKLSLQETITNQNLCPTYDERASIEIHVGLSAAPTHP